MINEDVVIKNLMLIQLSLECRWIEWRRLLFDFGIFIPQKDRFKDPPKRDNTFEYEPRLPYLRDGQQIQAL